MNVSDETLCVLGGGILGIATAVESARRNIPTRLFRLTDQSRPRADTLRNQAWLQSGLLMIDRFESRAQGILQAEKTYSWGRQMLRELRIDLPGEEEHGVVRVIDESKAEELVACATEMKLKRDLVRVLSKTEAKGLLGPFYEEGGVYLRVPDTPFDEAQVVRRFRDLAVHYGVEFCELVEGAQILECDGSLRVRVANETLIPQFTVAAAGAGNIPLLEQVGRQRQLSLRQTPLRVVENIELPTAQLFLDRVRHFSYVAKPTDGASNWGTLILGTRVRSETEFCPPEKRMISEKDSQTFYDFLPAFLRNEGDRGRFTAGVEVLPRGRSDVSEWILNHSARLCFAAPGRATLGLFTARKLVEERVLPAWEGSSLPATGMANRGQGWASPIHMHFEQHYDFDDSKNEG